MRAALYSEQLETAALARLGILEVQVSNKVNAANPKLQDSMPAAGHRVRTVPSANGAANLCPMPST